MNTKDHIKKNVLKHYDVTIEAASKKLNLKNYQTFTRRLDNPTLKSLEEIAEVVGCHLIELVPPPLGYVHYYESGKWEGIRKK